MVFFNYATMQMAAKIVYYGPGLCGKTTNLHVIYGRTAPTSRGEMVCLETETDRTLFFDLLPLDVGVIGGFKTRLQLYTVPGQVFYNTTRKLVLKGVDGIVFVADSQRPMRDPNVESLKNLRENLAEIGLTLESVPRVLQYNKRDLQNILSIDELNESLNPDRSVEWYECSATNGTGVFETLKAISKLTLRSLKGRMTVEQRRPTVVVSGETPAPIPAAALHAPGTGAHVSGITAAIESLGDAEGSGKTPPPARNAFDSTISRLQRLQALHRQGVDLHAASASGTSLAAMTPPPVAAPLSELPPPEAPFEAANLPPAEDPAAEVSFAEIQPPPDDPPPDSVVKHVRVRSNVDILSELEKLRKIATQRPPSPSHGRTKSAADVSLDDLLGSTRNHRRDVAQSFEVLVPRDALAKSRRVTVGLAFGDGEGGAIGPEKRFDVELSGAKDLQKLLLSLKFNVRAE
jgi:mutual gliding-motility protein MglA